MKRLLPLSLSLLFACSGAPDGARSERAKTRSQALTAEQCIYFESTAHQDVICHATSSAKNPYVKIKVDDRGCIDGHAKHPNDYIDVNDSDCGGAACLPVNAPCDATLPCCSGTCSPNHTCACSAGGATCATTSDCCSGTCTANGTCSTLQPDGSPCESSADCLSGRCVADPGGYGFTCQPLPS
jgi:hypothetical protein